MALRSSDGLLLPLYALYAKLFTDDLLYQNYPLRFMALGMQWIAVPVCPIDSVHICFYGETSTVKTCRMARRWLQSAASLAKECCAFRTGC